MEQLYQTLVRTLWKESQNTQIIQFIQASYQTIRNYILGLISEFEKEYYIYCNIKKENPILFFFLSFS